MSNFRGYEIELKKGIFYFKDTGLPTVETWEKRPCGHCGKHSIKDGDEDYDNCIGKLSGVQNACCGHGVESDAYIQYNDQRVIRGKEAIEAFDKLKI